LDGNAREIFLTGGDLLRSAGVDAPPVTVLMHKIKQGGLPVDTGALSPQEAADNILAALQEVSKC
ncbi:MAG: energy-coupling factor ABC transporter ATP-binding protein, partial [Sporomusaceae bacterium]|nr:energy-coupling factor ABC transporter ATP-binding protein [Sporomusaceae bacterium]